LRLVLEGMSVTTGREDRGIAIVGVACRYPGADEPRRLWEIVLGGRQQFRSLTECGHGGIGSGEPGRPAHRVAAAGPVALIDGVSLDRATPQALGAQARIDEIVYQLAMETALRALADAGYTAEKMPAGRCGVVMVNTRPEPETPDGTTNLRWPSARRALHAIAKAPLAEHRSDPLAGRICEALGFCGGGYTIDGRTASSLVAAAIAASALLNEDLDLALAGGIDLLVEPPEAPGSCLGEGCGFVALKQLRAARLAGDPVYAVLRGWGISSADRDVADASSAARRENAIRRAYARAGYPMRLIAFVESCGSGASATDREESEVLTRALGAGVPPRSCGITSLESIIGRTKAAAGIGSLVKAVVGVNRRVLPPSPDSANTGPAFEQEALALYPIRQGQVLAPADLLRAGVTGAGPDGFDCHLTIESADETTARFAPALEERALLAAHQATEVLAFTGATPADLEQRVAEVRELARGMASGELGDLAARLAYELRDQGGVRLAVIASADELSERLGQAGAFLEETGPVIETIASTADLAIWVGSGRQPLRVGCLFPGQGTQSLNAARVLVERHPWARDLVQKASIWLSDLGLEPATECLYRATDKTLDRGQLDEWARLLMRTEIAQPAVALTSLLWLRFLEGLGMRPCAAAGHSLGELAAFHAAGAFDDRTLIRLAGVRGAAMSQHSETGGAMAVLACDADTGQALASQVDGYLVVANRNSPRQTVLAGEADAVKRAIKAAAGQGIRGGRLAVANAFHSRFVAGAAEHLRSAAPIPPTLSSLRAVLITGADGSEAKPGLDLREHFARQLVLPVDFVAVVRALARQCDLILEVGPGRVLTDLSADILGGNPNRPPCLPVEASPGNDRDLNIALGALFAGGGEIRWHKLYERRLVQPFVPARDRHFVAAALE
jgi:enediyne polyketide synthase